MKKKKKKMKLNNRSVAWLVIGLSIIAFRQQLDDFEYFVVVVVAYNYTLYEPSINLIHKTCNHSDDYSLCVTILESDDRSLTATNGSTLAWLMLTFTQNKATQTLAEVKQILKKEEQSMSPETKRSFTTCNDVYELAIQFYIPAAMTAVSNTISFVDGRKEASDAFNLFQTCGRELFESVGTGLVEQDTLLDRVKFETHLTSLALDIMYGLY
ncbi:uncharacterized protein LOC122644698 [Telopea speciosissima]|uniref:uncharacterized protein LOC122644698 n=1 Tax=Telopea speciosissima TaxID=54955 RepID=UPI001CC6796D|nr:uncharacterized protein LOC122644698 [Telopea speciosissima]